MQTDPSFPFQVLPIADELVVVLTGEVDFAVATSLRQSVGSALRTPRPNQLVIDLRDVAFLDAAAAGALVAVSRDARSAGVAVEVRDAAPIPRRVLEIAGMFDVLRGDGGPADRPADSRRANRSDHP